MNFRSLTLWSFCVFLVNCSSDSEDEGSEQGTGGVSATGGAGTGGDLGQTGGASASGGSALGSGGLSSGGNQAAGGQFGSGGVPAGTGGVIDLPPVDCSSIASQENWELCESTSDTCSAVFTDSAGCPAVCAAAGLVCAEVWENAEDSCGADTSRTQLPCDPESGHQSDFCLCARDADSGSGGSSSTGGAGNSGGQSSGGATNSGGSGGSNSGGSPGSGGSPNDAPCAVPDYITSSPSPVGWASQDGGTTGGGNATPVLVTSLSAFKSEVSGSSAKVIYVEGDFSPDDISIGSNKTIIGCSSGAHLRGHLGIGSGSSNVILRNLNVSGYSVGNCSLDPDFDPSEGCSSGNDAVSVNGTAHHVWFDHCAIQDGTDGNLDITNNADFVTVSYTKFSYAPRQDNQGGDSTGGAGHRYSNLVGGTDSAPSGWPGTIPLNVTWHHNWWADNVVERMPRVRYGRNHLFNNYYSSNTSNYCVRAGIEAKILLQGNYFDGVDTPHEFNNSSNQQSAYISLGSGQFQNEYDGTSGDQETGGGGDEWNSPPYPFSVDPVATVPATVMSQAGPH